MERTAGRVSGGGEYGEKGRRADQPDDWVLRKAQEQKRRRRRNETAALQDPPTTRQWGWGGHQWFGGRDKRRGERGELIKDRPPCVPHLPNPSTINNHHPSSLHFFLSKKKKDKATIEEETRLRWWCLQQEVKCAQRQRLLPEMGHPKRLLKPN